jgi:hypothetical protein
MASEILVSAKIDPPAYNDYRRGRLATGFMPRHRCVFHYLPATHGAGAAEFFREMTMDVAILDEFRSLWASGGTDIRLRAGILRSKTQLIAQPGDPLIYITYANEGYYLASAQPEPAAQLKDLAAKAGASLSAIQRLKFGADNFSSPASIWFHVLFQLTASIAHEDYREIRDPVRASVVVAERLLDSQEAKPVAAPTSLHQGLASPAELANEWQTDPEATRQVLKRWREKHGDGWIENTEPKPSDPKFLYDRAAVRPAMQDLRLATLAVQKRPAYVQQNASKSPPASDAD